jgi:hypothetical protein
VRRPPAELPDDCESDPAACEPEPNDSDYFTFDVRADRPTFVKLAAKTVVEVADRTRSSDWDLLFQGFEIYTNGGISGPGAARAFGPLPATYFAFPDDPISTPFLIEDRAEGAFLRWYAYDGSDHTIYSRYHVYGIRSDEVLYKLQVLSYYGEVAGAPVSARYRLRYAAVDENGSGEAREVGDIDATAPDGETNPNAPSGCVALATGESSLLTPAQASESLAWDLCFRRDSISVNGELGGPGAVTAVDLAEGADESIDDVQAITPGEASTRFEGVDFEALSAAELEYRGDYATSAFTKKWVDRTTAPPSPFPYAWMVVGADGSSRYLVGFDSFEGATADAPGRLKLYVHPSP